jgi:hypothetical protein
MNSTAATKSGASRSLRLYLAILIVSSALYFIRIPGYSIYVFDLAFAVGLLFFPQYFLRIPLTYTSTVVIFAASVFASIFYCAIDNRPLDVVQALTIILRFIQMTLCMNFLYNCVRSGRLETRDFARPVLVALLIPLWGGLVLYFTVRDLAVEFGRYAGFLDNPNTMALYVVIVTPIFLTLWRFMRLPKLLSFSLIATFMVSAAFSMLISGSNSGIVLFLAVTIIGIVRSRWTLVFLFVLAVIVLLFEAPLTDMFLSWGRDFAKSDFRGLARTGELITSVLSGKGINDLGSGNFRDFVRQFLFNQQFQDVWRIIWGLGPGQSKLLFFGLTNISNVTIHNFYFGLLLEFGVVGALSFLAMAFQTVRRLRWNVDAFRASSGFLLASTATPALYLPFYWTTLFSTLALITLASARRRAYAASETAASAGRIASRAAPRAQAARSAGIGRERSYSLK